MNPTPRCRDDCGSSSLAAALLAPVFVVLMFAAFQAAMWGHARTEARVAANNAATQVARFGASTGAAEGSVFASLADSAIAIDAVDVAISPGSQIVTVTIRGRAQGIIIGTSRPIVVTEAIPLERIVP
jgi:Flp pilus assembly protein TadG